MPKQTFFNLKEEKQEKIVRTAIKEFDTHGFANANVGVIARNSEIAKGSIYQYFEGKKELFMYCVTWSLDHFMKRMDEQLPFEDLDLFEYFRFDIEQRYKLVREEKELAVFMQDVYLGKFHELTNESVEKWLIIADSYILALIRAGQKKGTIRTDIDERVLATFLTGASMKIKESILIEAKNSGIDITDERMEKFNSIINDMLDLLKSGMGSQQRSNHGTA